MRSKAVKVPLKEGEKIRKELKKIGSIRDDLIPKKKGRFLIIPVKEDVNGLDMVWEEFGEKKGKIVTYKDILDIPDHLKDLLPSSYDMIGDIILIKIPDELKRYEKAIGEALLKVHKSIRSVYHADPVKGDYRIRKLRLLAGEDNTLTLHREFGADIEVDLSRVFFSPRLSKERYRIAKLVKDGEIIIDMFAGCAPFSIVIAKHANPKIVYAIDINRDAIELARKNVKRNKLLHKIEIIEGDASEVVHKLAKNGLKADRIIMNHPFGARGFFQDALDVSKYGTMIHYYAILKDEDIENHVDHLKYQTGGQIEVMKINMIKTYAPREFYTCFDIIARKPA